MKIYIAGPMRGYDKYNFPAFEAAATQLRKLGLNVSSPHELDSDKIRKEALSSSTGELVDGKIGGETPGQILGRDVEHLIDSVDTIVFLPGWEKSKGARLEAFVGLLQGFKFYEYHSERGLGTQLDPSLVAGICAAQWMPREVRVMANVPEARKIAT